MSWSRELMTRRPSTTWSLCPSVTRCPRTSLHNAHVTTPRRAPSIIPRPRQIVNYVLGPGPGRVIKTTTGVCTILSSFGSRSSNWWRNDEYVESSILTWTLSLFIRVFKLLSKWIEQHWRGIQWWVQVLQIMLQLMGRERFISSAAIYSQHKHRTINRLGPGTALCDHICYII